MKRGLAELGFILDKSSFMDWFLEKTRLVEEEDTQQVFIKEIRAFEDAKQVIETYRRGEVCIFRFSPDRSLEAQGMMNFICGGIFALQGDVMEVGENVFMTLKK